MRTVLKYALLFLPFYFLTSCCDDGIPGEVPSDKEEKQLTITYLLYMVGQNDLSSFLTENIKDLKAGFEKTDIKANILVYADISSTPELYLIQKDEKGVVTKNTVRTYPDQYSVDPRVMKSVINSVFQDYPGDLRAVTFSSHADGSLYTSGVVKRSFGYEGSGYGMNITDLREALDGCPHMDLIMFDACMMASVETAYELKNNTHYLLAAPNSVPGEGCPYDKILPYILQMNEKGFVEVAKIYMDYFHHNSVKWDDFVSISLTDVTKLDSLSLYMDSLFQDKTVQEQARYVKRNQLQEYEIGYALYDFGNWVDSIGKNCPYLPKVKEYLDKAVVYKAHSDYSSVDDWGINMLIPVDDEKFCGLNTYVPPSDNYKSEYYQRSFFTTLRWYRDAGLYRSSYYSYFE